MCPYAAAKRRRAARPTGRDFQEAACCASAHEIGERYNPDAAALGIAHRELVGMARGHRGKRLPQRGVERNRLALGSLAATQAIGDPAHRQQLEPETLMTDEVADEVVCRMLENVERQAELHNSATLHYRDLGGEA